MINSASPDLNDPTAPQSDGGRLAFVDVLRVVVIILVVAHHSAQPYGPTGGEWAVTDPANTEWLGPFFAVNAAFGLGLLFLLAGYFVPRSYDRKGGRRFLKDRWGRIGVPLVIFALVMNVPAAYLIESVRPSMGEFVRPPRTWPVPGHIAIVAFVIGLALVTWIVRIWYPIDEWVPLLFVVAAEPAHLPQYIGLFAVGVVAYRGDWLRRLPQRLGMIWLGVGLVASAGIYVFKLGAPDRWDEITAGGGFVAQSLVSSTWEALICVGLCLGLITLFRTMFTRTNRVLLAMAAASYAAYILHLTIVVLLQLGILELDLPATVKFGLVTAFGVALSFGVAHLSRRIPGLRTILGTTPSTPEVVSSDREASV